jgi:hypothetical protein
MIALRLAALLCFAGLLFHPVEISAKTMRSPEIQRRIDDVWACLMTKVVERDDPHTPVKGSRTAWPPTMCRVLSGGPYPALRSVRSVFPIDVLIDQPRHRARLVFRQHAVGPPCPALENGVIRNHRRI